MKQFENATAGHSPSLGEGIGSLGKSAALRNAARARPLKGQLSKATWDTRETLDWIIYRGGEPDAVDAFLIRGVHMDDDIMGCLRARALGDPRSWVPDPPVPSSLPDPRVRQPAPKPKRLRYSGRRQAFWGERNGPFGTAAQCRARMRQWMRDMRLPAEDLFAHGNALREQANALIDAQNATNQAALAELNNAAQGGLLLVRGCKRITVFYPSCKPVREDIPKEQFDDIRQITPLGAISIHDVSNSFAFLGHEPPFYWSLEFNPDEVMGLWPAPQEEAEAGGVHHPGAPPIVALPPPDLDVQRLPADRTEANAAVAAEHAGEVHPGVGPHVQEVAATDCCDAALPHVKKDRRPPSRANAKRWLEDRYKDLPKGARLPSEGPEWFDAVKAFPGLSRQLFRNVRDEVRPDLCRKIGRPTSSVKVAAGE